MEAKQAAEVIKEIQYITIATSVDDEPWNTPVYSAYDSNLMFYWSSHPNAQHSKNIAKNPNVFLVIYNSKIKEGQGRGVYIQGNASHVTSEKETARAQTLLANRKGIEPINKTMVEIAPQAIYKITPVKMWLNNAEQKDDGSFIKDFRIEVPIDEVKKHLT